LPTRKSRESIPATTTDKKAVRESIPAPVKKKKKKNTVRVYRCKITRE